jgi:hypothetical protein
MPDKLSEDERIKAEIDSLFEAAEKERYVHSRSKETFDSIAGLWFLGDTFKSTLAYISSSYIVSSFLLNSLGLAYKSIRSDYGLPEFDSSALTNNEARREFLKELERLKADEIFVKWLKDFLIPKCEELLESIKGEELEDIAKLGNMADSTEHIARHYVSKEDGDTWIYDSIFQFSDEFLLSSDKPRFEQAGATILNPIDRERSPDNLSHFSSPFESDENTSQYDIPVGESATALRRVA